MLTGTLSYTPGMTAAQTDGAVAYNSHAIRAALDPVHMVAPTSATVLLLGETGVGKEGWRMRGASGAARRLGIKPMTLESRIAKLGILRNRDASGEPFPVSRA